MEQHQGFKTINIILKVGKTITFAWHIDESCESDYQSFEWKNKILFFYNEQTDQRNVIFLFATNCVFIVSKFQFVYTFLFLFASVNVKLYRQSWARFLSGGCRSSCARQVVIVFERVKRTLIENWWWLMARLGWFGKGPDFGLCVCAIF